METTEQSQEPTKALKWNDDKERRRTYHNKYYQKRKATRSLQPPPPKKKGLVDWNNPLEVAALKRTYAQKEVECEACKKTVHACSITHHRRSKRHLLAVALWLKGGTGGVV
jgi:hypothetical protein